MQQSGYHYCPLCHRQTRMLTSAQAADILDVSRRTIYRWVQERKIHAIRRPSGRLRICEDSLLGFHQGSLPTPSPSPGDERIQLVLDMIEEQYPDAHLTLDELSEHVRLSTGYLSKLFKRETGSSFRQHLRAVRVRKAEPLLHNPRLSIKEVAIAVGYRPRCVSDFTRHFKAAYGMTPSEYRRSTAIKKGEGR